jgi:SecD/SecF fusion protein
VRSRGYITILVIVLAMLAATVALAVTRSPVLGLDLRGGSEIVLQAQPDKGVVVTSAMMDQAVSVYERRVNALGTTEANVQKDNGNRITVQLPGEKDPGRVDALIGSTGTLYFIDLYNGLTPGVSRSVVTQLGGISPKTSLHDLLSGVQRLSTSNDSAYYAFDAQGHQKNPQAAKTIQDLYLALNISSLPPGWKVLGVPQGKLAVSCSYSADHAFCPGVTALPPPANAPATYWYLFDLPPASQLLTGRDLTAAQADVDPNTGQPIVTMSFDDHGAALFTKITAKLAHDGKAAYDAAVAAGQTATASNYFRPFAIILDGQLESYPIIDFTQNPDGITGNNSQITGVTSAESHNIADVLSSGSLPVSFFRVSQTQISATLGKTSLRQGLIAGIAGLVVVMLYMIVFYRVLGLIADLALIIYAVLFYGVILAIPVTLTLPGIAGLILTIGVAADANVVVFERIKEEVRAGKTVRASIAGGYTKGFHTIIDANVVTLITAAVLFTASQSSVKGFAFLLAIGVLVSMFTAVAATRAMLGLLGGFRWFNNAALMGATARPIRWKFDFIGRARIGFALSGIVIAIGLGSLAVQGLNKGLDFTGGTRIAFSLQGTTATVDEIRSIIAPAAKPLTDAVVRGTGAANGDRYAGFQVDSKELTADQVSSMRFALDKQFGAQAVPNAKFNQTSVSASFGSQILQSAIYAFVFSILLIVAYLAFRFDWRYALPTIAALAHDLLVTIGIYSLTGREVNSATVAAVLTILGYSLYDTIIVFDRVRENERLLRRHTYPQIVNISLWETLTRSLNTTSITLLPILSLFLFGGSTLKDFAFALLIGILSGAYSSFFIASPLLVYLKQRESQFAKRRGSDELPSVFLRGSEPPAPAGVGAVVAPPPDGSPTAQTAEPPAPIEPAPAPAPVATATPPTDAAAREAARQRRLERKNRRR